MPSTASLDCKLPLLPIDVEEGIQVYTPLSSRIAHLVIIDVLAIGVAQQKGEKLQAHLQGLQKGLKSLRLPADVT